MGRKIIIPGITFTDNTLPKLPDYDQIESSGSLFLWEPGHSLSELAANYVPAAALETMNNIVWSKAQAVLNNGQTKASLAAVVSNRNANSSEFLLERTSKGGMHGIITQTTQTVNAAVTIKIPQPLREYMVANIAHKLYFSMWRKLTRPTLANAAQQSPFHWAMNTTQFFFHTSSGGIEPNIAERTMLPNATADSGQAAGTNRFNSIAIAAQTGAAFDYTNAFFQPEFGWGNFGAWAGFNFNKAPSHVIYRIYVEDLTVSGRSYAAVNALDQQLYNAAFGVGGRYNGDTYTDPATRP